MDKQLVSKVTTFSFLAAAGLTYISVNILFKSLAGAFGIFQRWYSIDVLNHGVPLVSAVALFFVLQFNKKITQWAEEVVLEVSKVVWPSQKDTMAMTMVVCTFVFVACVILLAIDFVAHNLVKMIIQ